MRFLAVSRLFCATETTPSEYGDVLAQAIYVITERIQNNLAAVSCRSGEEIFGGMPFKVAWKAITDFIKNPLQVCLNPA